MDNKKTILLTRTRTFTRTASIEVELPDNVSYEEAEDWLYDEGSWAFDELDGKVSVAELLHDSEFVNTRYDVYEHKVLREKKWGGTL
jgi:hypothetical protein